MFLIIDFFQPFCIFPMKTSPNRVISILVRKVKKTGLQSLYHGKFDPKREVCTLKGTMTLTDYKSLFIYTHLYLQALIQDSGSIPLESGGIWQNGCIPAGICGASKSTVDFPWQGLCQGVPLQEFSSLHPELGC